MDTRLSPTVGTATKITEREYSFKHIIPYAFV